jgi:hypothetical protein
VRPSESSAEHFQELPVTVNVSKAGLYFHTHLSAYRVGMRLFVTYPFTFADDPMKSEYLAEVVRVDKLADIWGRSSSGDDGLALRLRTPTLLNSPS